MSNRRTNEPRPLEVEGSTAGASGGRDLVEINESCWCGRSPLTLGITYKQDGIPNIFKYCPVAHVNGGFSLKDLDTWENLPVVRDYRGKTPACEKCGEPYSQEHHWAPYEIFGDEANQWPMGWLCSSCHHRWHTMMNRARSRRGNGVISAH